jgi:hypothetical protein
MHSIDATVGDERQGRFDTWRIVRWLITAAASLVLVTLFLTQTAATEAAAPTPTSDAVYQQMAAPQCQQGYNCLINNCVSGNYYFCSYNLGYNYPYNLGYATTCAYINCGVNYIAPAVYNFPYYNGFYRGIYNFPNFIGANNVCAAGNFSCYRANYPYVGNPYWWAGAPYYRPLEVAQPAAAPVAAPVAAPAQVTAPVAAPVAAPAVPAANYATALNATTQASAPAVVTASSPSVTIYSVPSATTPTVTKDLDDHR